MSKKAKPQVAQVTPWAESTPYMLGDAKRGIAGLLPEANSQFQRGQQLTPQIQQVADLYSNYVMNRATDPNMDFAQRGAGDIMRGSFDTNFNPVANTQFQNINTPQTDLRAARAGQGVLNPTNAMQGMLSGRPDNPYLDQQAAAITGQLTRNLNENVMPGLRSEALASGQYGGSRQGIAEGLAASRLNQDLAPALTNLYGTAFENAQQRKFGTASQLNDQAFQNATGNANRQFAGNQFNASNNLANQQFNANLGLQNNAQQLQRNQANLNNRLQGLGVLQGVNGMQDQNFSNYLNALQVPNNFNMQNLNNYAGLVQPSTGMGQTQTQTMYKNPFAGALGGAAAGSMFGAPGASIGGGLGLLGGLF